MAFFSTFSPELIGVYDEELTVTYFGPNNNGRTIGRDSLENVHHAGGAPQQHPTLNNVIKNTNGHVFIDGSFQFEWRWDPNDVTEADMNAYVSLLESQIPVGCVITNDVANNKILLDFPDSDYGVPEWSGQLVQWHPKAPYAKITSTSDDAEFVCVTRLNGTYHQYTFEQKTVDANETLEVTRPASDKCFVMFTGDVTKDGVALTKYKLYKLTSSSIQITNTGAKRIKVLRYTKGGV